MSAHRFYQSRSFDPTTLQAVCVRLPTMRAACVYVKVESAKRAARHPWMLVGLSLPSTCSESCCETKLNQCNRLCFVQQQGFGNDLVLSSVQRKLSCRLGHPSKHSLLLRLCPRAETAFAYLVDDWREHARCISCDLTKMSLTFTCPVIESNTLQGYVL